MNLINFEVKALKRNSFYYAHRVLRNSSLTLLTAGTKRTAYDAQALNCLPRNTDGAKHRAIFPVVPVMVCREQTADIPATTQECNARRSIQGPPGS